MRVGRSLRVIQSASHSHSTSTLWRTSLPFIHAYRQFHSTPITQKIQTHILSDIGEGVKEVQIIQWFIEEGAAVEEWAPLCEVQSDKASVEITSKYSGIVKKLHFEQDAIVQVGDVMLDIEVEDDGETPEEAKQEEGVQKKEQEPAQQEEQDEKGIKVETEVQEAEEKSESSEPTQKSEDSSSKSHASLATPAVRGLLKEHGLDIADVTGSGRDGRVLKDDVYKHLESSKSAPPSVSSPVLERPKIDSKQTETTQHLTPIQSAMFKSMTKSLTIPHFLFSDSINMTSLASTRTNLNNTRDQSTPKLSYLPFIIKAVSLALNKYPILNARLDTSTSKPSLVPRSNHNIGIAMDTPAGLLVPVIKSVNARSITSIAQELAHLSSLAQSGKLQTSDLTGGTITVSNIGNIGGQTVGPVIVEGQLAIMGIGKIKPTPMFAADGKTVERADLMTASWSADHRVVDGATMARMAVLVQGYLERPEKMLLDMS